MFNKALSANMIHSSDLEAASLSSIFTPQVQLWASDILRWSITADLDPNLVAVVMQIESCGDPNAASRAGAMGLFQVMPYHFAAFEDPYSPDTNAQRGLHYLSLSLVAAGNDVRLALAGYNGGLSLVARPEQEWPAETIRYVYWGSGIYSDAVSCLKASERLNEWLLAGGASLCNRARQAVALSG